MQESQIEVISQENKETSSDLASSMIVRKRQTEIPFNKDDLSKIEKVLNELVEELSDLEELREVINVVIENEQKSDDYFKEQFLSYFHSFNERTEKLLNKMDNEVIYNETLQDKINNHELKAQVTLLEKELMEERAKIVAFISEMNKTISDTTSEINSKIAELKSVNDVIQDSLNEYKKEFSSFAEENVFGLTRRLELMLKQFVETAQNTITVVQTKSVDFLKQCNDENIDLKSNSFIPKKNKHKDILLYSLSICSIACCLFQVIQSF